MVDTVWNRVRYWWKKTPMDFKINGQLVTTAPMNVKSRITHDKPNINVTTGEIRLTHVKGKVSIVSISIIAQGESEPHSAARKEVAKNTFSGGDCSKNTKNCIFDEAMMSAVKCDGQFVKIGARAVNKQLACRWKCVEKSYKTVEECDNFRTETLTCCKKNGVFSLISDKK